jgi:8-oxo-dGTP diphosphatase
MHPAPFDPHALPKKRMAAGALITDGSDRILLVKPVYRPEWLIPGGSIEVDESPATGCAREVHEELGFSIPIGALLLCEYSPRTTERPEAMQFIFDGGVFDAATTARIRLPADELSEFRFVQVDQAAGMLPAKLGNRMRFALKMRKLGAPLYLENGALYRGA